MTGICEHTSTPELGAYADGELAGAARAWWEQHVRTCARCREEVRRIRSLGAAIRENLPPSEPSPALRDAVRRGVRTRGTARPVAWVLRPAWRTGIAAALLLGAGFWLGDRAGAGRAARADVAAEVVAAHVRSLQVNHLVDVASSAHHVVKPWFAGKLDFSPPVLDLAADSFPMVGARTEYLDDRPVAAIVYASGPHEINFLVWPAAREGACGREPLTVRQGFNLVHGRTADMQFWAISDLNPAELQAFVAAWLRAARADGACGPA